MTTTVGLALEEARYYLPALRYRLTNRRVIVERPLQKIEERSVALDRFDEAVDPFTNLTAERLAANVQSEFDSWRGCLDISGIRAWFRKQIEDEIGAFVVRSGGVIWFALERHRAIVRDAFARRG